MGREPVVVVRKNRNEIGVLVNRCAHRGSMVCAEGRGNIERFVCPYHGWSYDRAGALQAVPFSAGYEKDKLPAGLNAEPRVGRSEVHTSELQSLAYLVCRLLLEKKKIN